MRKYFIFSLFLYRVILYVYRSIRSNHNFFFLLYPGQPSFSFLCRMNMIPSVCRPRCQFRHKHFPLIFFPSSRHFKHYSGFSNFISTRFNSMLIVVLSLDIIQLCRTSTMFVYPSITVHKMFYEIGIRGVFVICLEIKSYALGGCVTPLFDDSFRAAVAVTYFDSWITKHRTDGQCHQLLQYILNTTIKKSLFL